MIRTLVILLTLVVCYNTAIAQKCLTAEKVQQSIARYPEIARAAAEVEEFTRDFVKNYRAEQKGTAVQVIPVVVHVLYKSGEPYVSDEQILSQFPTLNAAFNNTIFSANTPAAFKPLCGNAEMEFCLTKIAPDGSPTTGILRKEVVSSFNGEKDYFNHWNGGTTPWDPKRYINVYLVSLNQPLLGFTYRPKTAPPGEEGVVVDIRAWGNAGIAINNAPYNMGMTAVHEFGHYLNLEHMWGTQGGCISDDGIPDTPLQSAPTGGCPSFPLYDLCTATGDGIMFMNYMDYTNDMCNTMFTVGQTIRMKSALKGPLAGLAGSYLCYPTDVDKVDGAEFSIAPNPANDKVTISSKGDIHAVLLNTNGTVIMTEDGKERVTLMTGQLPAGLYILQLTNATESTTRKIIVQH